MLKKIFVGALIAVSSLGTFSVSEAHHGDYDCRDNDHYKNYCCGGNYYERGNSQNNYDCCYDGAYCCR